MNTNVSGANQPLIVKYSVSERNGIQAINLSRNAIGYVSKGKKHIHYGDVCYEIGQGELFYINIGTHYVEDIPDDKKVFEQFMFYYSSELISDILGSLTRNYGMVITNKHKCEKCGNKLHASVPAWSSLKSFFTAAGQLLKEGEFPGYNVVEKLKMTELICLIMAKQDCCVASKILTNITSSSESFERLVQKHIFEDITIEEMAERCGMSLTSFKRSFKNHFYEPPHRWILRQRLMQARMLLISTDRTISDIGSRCGFNNTSHFIKLFKAEFGYTPAAYRAKSLREGEPDLKVKHRQGKTATY